MALLSLFGVIAAPAAAAEGRADVLAAPLSGCSGVHFSVTLQDASPVQVSGRLCLPVDVRSGRPLQILLAGATYDSRYWALPAAPGSPSWVGSMMASGEPTLAIDRPGTGGSGRPPADALTVSSEADVVHQLVDQLRKGRIGRVRPGRVVLVGHSLGTSIALVEASRYHDVDGVVASGFLHAAYGPQLGNLFSGLQPASQDPVLARSAEPAGYLTTRPNTRADLFYSPPDASRITVALDELTKSTMTTGEQASIASAADPAISQAISAPVLVAVGENDQLFCGGPLSFPCTTSAAVLEHEQPFYSPAAALEAYVLPGSGHVINLHENSSTWFAAVRGWIDRHVSA